MDRRLILRVVDSPDRDSPAGLRVTTVSSSALQRVTVGARAAALRAVHSGRRCPPYSYRPEPGPRAVPGDSESADSVSARPGAAPASPSLARRRSDSMALSALSASACGRGLPGKSTSWDPPWLLRLTPAGLPVIMSHGRPARRDLT